jgi:hypothetical protein
MSTLSKFSFSLAFQILFGDRPCGPHAKQVVKAFNSTSFPAHYIIHPSMHFVRMKKAPNSCILVSGKCEILTISKLLILVSPAMIYKRLAFFCNSAEQP